MIAEPKTQPTTAEEFWAAPRFERSEVINGEEIELMPPGFDHGEYAGDIYMALRLFVRAHTLGRVSTEAGFVLERDPTIVRSPDVSYVEAVRLEGVDTSKWIEGAPTLAVEIVSPGDLWSEVEDKVALYLRCGTRVVWIVDPATKTVQVRHDGDVHIFRQNETLDGGDMLPGFRLPLPEIFG